MMENGIFLQPGTKGKLYQLPCILANLSLGQESFSDTNRKLHSDRRVKHPTSLKNPKNLCIQQKSLKINENKMDGTEKNIFEIILGDVCMLISVIDRTNGQKIRNENNVLRTSSAIQI